MIQDILTNFSERVTLNNNDIVMEVTRFYKFLQEEERVALDSEVRKIFPFESTSNMPKEVFAILVSLGNEQRNLKNVGISEKDRSEAAKNFFTNIISSDFYKYLIKI